MRFASISVGTKTCCFFLRHCGLFLTSHPAKCIRNQKGKKHPHASQPESMNTTAPNVSSFLHVCKIVFY